MHTLLKLSLVILCEIVGLARSGDYGIPFPLKTNQKEYMQLYNSVRCGGNISQPVVITTKNYPFGNSGEDECIWIVKTRRCFTPKLTVVARDGYDANWTPFELIFGDSKIRLMDKPNGFVYYAPTTMGKIYFRNRLGWDGYGFQMLVDFIPKTTPECLSEFTEQTALTCVPTPIKNGFTLQTPGYPLLSEAGTSCQQSFYIDEDVKTYLISIEANMRDGGRFEFRDGFYKETIVEDNFQDSIVATKPFSISYKSDKLLASSNFKLDIVESKSLEPCATTIQVTSTPKVIKNPSLPHATTVCAIKFESSIANKTLLFNFEKFVIDEESEQAKLLKNLRKIRGAELIRPTMKTATASSPAAFIYKSLDISSPWEFSVSLVD